MDREPLVSILITSLYALFSVFTPFGYIVSVVHPQPSPFAGLGLVLFIIGYFGFFAVAFFGFSLDGPLRGRLGRDAKNPGSLHAFQLKLMAVFLPAAILVGSALTAIAAQFDYITCLWMAFWFEFSYVLSFTVLRFIYSALFRMQYLSPRMTSPVVARDLILSSIRRFEESRILAGMADLEAGYAMIVDWIRSLGYECQPIVKVARQLSTALTLDVRPTTPSLLALAQALEKLPDWASVVERLSAEEVSSLKWASCFESREARRTKIFENALNVLVAFGTLAAAFVTPFLVLYSSAFAAAVERISPSAGMIAFLLVDVVMLVLCAIRWRGIWIWVYPGPELELKIGQEEAAVKQEPRRERFRI